MVNQKMIREAKNGDVNTQYRLGLSYCVEGKVEEALFWLKKVKEEHYKSYLKVRKVLEEVHDICQKLSGQAPDQKKENAS